MLAELVFVTRFLGLTAGEQDVALRADASVKRVEIRRDGETIATMTGPPWRKRVALGEELGPYELTAVGFDASGDEVARDAQLVNLARPAAEAGILLERDANGALTARLQWTHLGGRRPVSAQLTLDGDVISRSASAEPVPLGVVDPARIHVVGAEIAFLDGVRARKDIVFGGVYAEEIPSELTAIAVRVRDETKRDCVRVRGKQVAPTAVERTPARVSFVVNGGAGVAVQDLSVTRARLYEIPDAEMVVVSPVVRAAAAADSFDTQAVPNTRGTRAAVMMDARPRGRKQFADAVAASALRSLRDGKRRAVVYVLGNGAAPDLSDNSPAVVRRYLARIGVPLRVWSMTGPRPDLVDSWGPVIDVSNAPLLLKATNDLREELDTQRIAWVPAGPLEALRADATEDCGVIPIAKWSGSVQAAGDRSSARTP